MIMMESVSITKEKIMLRKTVTTTTKLVNANSTTMKANNCHINRV